MIFNLFLKLVKAETEADRLKWSVYYGWGLVVISLLTFSLIGLQENSSTPANSDFAVTLFIIAILLFSFRYTSVKPFLGAVAGGVSVISLAMLFDSLFSRRDSSASFGAFVGVMFVLLFMLIKNIIIGLYYLIRETIRYVQYKKANEQTELEATELSATSNS